MRAAQSARTDDDTLCLIGRRQVSTNNSWMHQYKKLSASRLVRCTAMINPQDAQRLAISDGDDIQLASCNGEILLPAEVTDAVMQGVVCVPMASAIPDRESVYRSRKPRPASASTTSPIRRTLTD